MTLKLALHKFWNKLTAAEVGLYLHLIIRNDLCQQAGHTLLAASVMYLYIVFATCTRYFGKIGKDVYMIGLACRTAS